MLVFFYSNTDPSVDPISHYPFLPLLAKEGNPNRQYASVPFKLAAQIDLVSGSGGNLFTRDGRGREKEKSGFFFV